MSKKQMSILINQSSENVYTPQWKKCDGMIMIPKTAKQLENGPYPNSLPAVLGGKPMIFKMEIKPGLCTPRFLPPAGWQGKFLGKGSFGVVRRAYVREPRDESHLWSYSEVW